MRAGDKVASALVHITLTATTMTTTCLIDKTPEFTFRGHAVSQNEEVPQLVVRPIIVLL